jgi:YihY family inner membrane protein
MDRLQRLLRALDRFQQAHPWIGLPIAVVRKYGDDQGGNHAALLAYYGFFSLFPLLLVLTTVLGFVLDGRPDLQARILDSALAQFPVIGVDIRENLGALQGSRLALAVGLIGALYGGLGVAEAAQNAMNGIWNVPRKRYPNFLVRRARGLLWLVGLGGGLLLITVLSGVTAAAGTAVARLLGVGVSLAVDTLLFLLAFRVLTVRDVAVRELLPGAVLASLGWLVLQQLGGWYVDSQLKRASDTYGTFALVIGLLSWLYLAATVTLYAAEVNVVRSRRLWPRSLIQPPLAGADERVLEALAKQEERRPEETVEVVFHRDDSADGRPAEPDGADRDPAEPDRADRDRADRDPPTPRG